jgi:hypothetical protein
LRARIPLDGPEPRRACGRLLKRAGVGAEVKRKIGDGDEWYVKAATDKLRLGTRSSEKPSPKIVRKTVKDGWVDADKAERWLEKLEKGLTLKEGWPKYLVRLIEGALVVRFSSPNRKSIEQEAQRLEKMGP